MTFLATWECASDFLEMLPNFKMACGHFPVDPTCKASATLCLLPPPMFDLLAQGWNMVDQY